MNDFVDVEQFARPRAGCRGPTPSIQSQPGRDPAIDLGPAVKRAVETAVPPAAAARAGARTRGVAAGAALAPLWECAAAELAALEKIRAGGSGRPVAPAARPSAA